MTVKQVKTASVQALGTPMTDWTEIKWHLSAIWFIIVKRLRRK